MFIHVFFKEGVAGSKGWRGGLGRGSCLVLRTDCPDWQSDRKWGCQTAKGEEGGADGQKPQNNLSVFHL